MKGFGGRLAIITIILAGLAFFAGALATALLMIGIILFLFQGLSIVHGVVAARHLSRHWIAGVYMALFIFTHVIGPLLALFGLLDTWFDVRRRLAPPQDS